MSQFASIASILTEVRDGLEAFLIAHREMAGPILGVIAFGESLVLIGLFFPATAIMLFAGGLIQQGKLDAASVIGWSIAGAVLGDIVTYWLGRWIGPSVVHHWPVNRINRTSIARARLFFRKFGFLSIFIGRFLGPVRSTIPLVAGIMRMRHLTFQIANVTSAMAWVPFMLLPGYFFARSVGDFSTLSGAQWIAIGVMILLMTALFSFIALKMQGKSAKDKRQERRSAAAAE